MNADLFDAIERYDVERVALCIASGASVTQPDAHGKTPLWYAGRDDAPDRSRQLAIVQTLVLAGATLDLELRWQVETLAIGPAFMLWQRVRHIERERAALHHAVAGSLAENRPRERL